MSNACVFILSGCPNPYKKEMCDTFKPSNKVMNWINSQVNLQFKDKIKTGDFIRCINGSENNEGYFMWTGNKAVPLESEPHINENGYIPSFFVFDIIENTSLSVNDPYYWVGVLNNSIMWPSLRLRHIVADGLKRGAYHERRDRFISSIPTRDGKCVPFILDSSHFGFSAGTNIYNAKGMILDMDNPFLFSEIEKGKITLKSMDDYELFKYSSESLDNVFIPSNNEPQTFGQFKDGDQVIS
jgi:hypothetical protein